MNHIFPPHLQMLADLSLEDEDALFAYIAPALVWERYIRAQQETYDYFHLNPVSLYPVLAGVVDYDVAALVATETAVTQDRKRTHEKVEIPHPKRQKVIPKENKACAVQQRKKKNLTEPRGETSWILCLKELFSKVLY